MVKAEGVADSDENTTLPLHAYVTNLVKIINQSFVMFTLHDSFSIHFCELENKKNYYSKAHLALIIILYNYAW